MESIIGIDLGTTNSAVSIVKDGKPMVILNRGQSAILPSVIGFTNNGELLVGAAARNQALVAPDRTVKSIKRKMGQDEAVHVAGRTYSPQELSAMIVRTLKERAEEKLGHSVTKAVITVPAYFSENQRVATREAGELAGLEVMRIINEPTAATLTYEPHSEKSERLLVYDLGGGTFDVSIVQIERGVIEVLASHGDTQLGGDDFDQLLFDHVRDFFKNQYDIDLQTDPIAKSRLLQAVERAKIELSNEAIVTLAEEFIADKSGKPLNLHLEIDRFEYESLIEPLLRKTLDSVDKALADANLTAAQLDRVLLVGGSSRTPLVRRLLKEQLGHDPHAEIDPDLCVSMGAGVQGGLIAGVDVGAVLVDITPHTLGIQCVGELNGRPTDKVFSTIITRNTALPATRSEVYCTGYEGQDAARIEVFQGEHEDVSYNQSVGGFLLDGLDEESGPGNEILVRFNLDLDGILTVTAVERETGLDKKLTIENAMTRSSSANREAATSKLDEVFGDGLVGSLTRREVGAAEPSDAAQIAPEDPLAAKADELVAKARRIVGMAATEDAGEIRALVDDLQRAKSSSDLNSLQGFSQRLEDLLFYVEDA